MENENKKLADKKNVVHKAEVVSHGTELVLPQTMTIDQAIGVLQRRKEYDEQEVNIIIDVKGAFVWDGAIALGKAMEAMFGFSMAEPTHSFFGKNPPNLIEVQSGPNETTPVPWGSFSIPMLSDARVSTGFQVKDGQMFLQFSAKCKRKHKETIEELGRLTKNIAHKESIYRSKAFRIKIDDVKIPEPVFMDVSKVNGDNLIFSKTVEKSIHTSIFTPIEKTQRCREANIPLKRGVLLTGPYGTGKTLTASVTAKKCTENGWTFLYCERAQDLGRVVRFAQYYEPCVIFCEDIDRATDGKRDVAMDEILNIVDGIDSKDSEIMIVLTTNHVENIHQAMLRPGRLDAVINVLPPDPEATEKLMRLFANSCLKDKTDLTAASVALAGNIPAIIRECVERSKLTALKLSGGQSTEITGEALLESAETMEQQLELLKPKAKAQNTHERLGAALSEIIETSVFADKMNAIKDDIIDGRK